ncbi:MAG: prolipoprotein diacylglyceryl transferase [Leptospirillia bacterium]
MLNYPNIDPVLLHLGPIKIRWYGTMYLLGFVIGYLLTIKQSREGLLKATADQIGGLTTALILGVILGGRLGYVLFYDFSAYLSHPADILAIWKGGMSFHGGLIGSLIAGAIFCRRQGLSYLGTADRVAVVVPVGLGLGRIANFINVELYGRVSDVPWAMVFPGGGPLPRHPSQLYEAFFEGVVLFTVLWLLRKRLSRPGQLLGLFMLLYAVFRMFGELFRQPDAHIGFLLFGTTMGQWLSFVMLAAGIWLLATARRRTPEGDGG